MAGHGHVTPNPDGSKARCGGPRICTVCALEQANVQPVASHESGNDVTIHGYPPLTPPARTPHKCPVCGGRGRVDRSFYGDTMNASKYLVCQSCHGTGVVWS
jgi:hypothetical protein